MTKHTKHRCRLCGCHNARFMVRGRWKADRHHDVCPRCYRSLVDRQRSMSLKQRRGSAEPLALPLAA